ncbi:MAG: glycosyltransferase family 4 protein [Ruminococcaceae bacterium]|nr:glycosyltransferase family 4 protein [Oscillospiraceae bacterium]
MKIVHIAPISPYNDYWGYQDNLLPKYHKKLGHDVTVIITNQMHRDGRIVTTDCGDYVLNDGVRVIRMAVKKYKHRVLTTMNSRFHVMPYLNEIKPDFVFYHGLVGTTIYEVMEYKKKVNPDCVIVQDSHLDYYNSLYNGSVRQKLIRSFYRMVNRRSIPYVSRVYGVTPWRRQYAEDYFGIPSDKTDVLIMGADDEKIDFAGRDAIRRKIREENGVGEDDFLIVTGGKIDKTKHIDDLMRACGGMDRVKLLVFGNVSDDMKEAFEKLLSDHPNLIHIGWLDADRVYDYFLSAELVCFPGTHSVMWEQACACKVPCLFARWDGMEHVDNGGNSGFIDDPSPEGLREKISELIFGEKYMEMKAAAQSEKTDIYLYSKIAEKSLECVYK